MRGVISMPYLREVGDWRLEVGLRLRTFRPPTSSFLLPASRPLLPQDGHDHYVHRPALAEAVGTEQPLPHEAALLIAVDASHVIFVHLEIHATKAQLIEAVAQHPPYGVRAVAAVPELLLADGDAQCGAALPLVDRVQPQVADGLPFPRLDAPEHAAGVLAHLVIPLPLRLQRKLGLVRYGQPAAHVRVVEPAHEQRQVFLPRRPQAHSLPRQNAL